MLKPWFWISAKQAHDLAPWALPLMARVTPKAPERPFTWRHLNFRNRCSIAGGVDKNATMLSAWDRLGLGFIEIGTVTPEPQSPNPGVIMGREVKTQALWNKMGFPNEGAKVVFDRLSRAKLQVPLLVNIGKNRTTPNEDAASDYAKCAEVFDSVADIFVINISSPNTSGLRDLQGKEFLKGIFDKVRTKTEKPILVKLSPDSPDEVFLQTLSATVELEVDGWILTNTTTSKSGTNFQNEGGGVSGLPLKERSRHLLERAIDHLGESRTGRLLISAGGITDPMEARHRLQLGADLVETYSGLIYYGPRFFADV